MDLKDMVVRKRMASLNASAILAASYSSEKRSNRKDSSVSTEDGMSSVEENDEDNIKIKADEKKSNEQQKSPEEKNKVETGTIPECTEYRHKKHFWKTKVESLKKSSKEKRNSPSPILADFGLEKDLSTKVLEKEKNDEINDDKEKLIYPPKKFLEGKLKSKAFDPKLKKVKSGGKEILCEKDKDVKRKYTKRKLCEDEVKNITIEKVGGVEKTDEYKSDSDNGQRKLIELRNTGGSNKKVAVIVNQDTDVTITGVYVNSTRSTHHEGYCSIAGMQYRISSTSHTQTEATAVLKTSTASEQTPSPTEPTNCTSPRNHKSYTPLSALSNMQPPAGATHTHLPPPPPPAPHHHHHLCGMGQHLPPPEHCLSHGPVSHQRPLSPLGRRHGCSSAFSAPHYSSHHAPGRPPSPSHEGDNFGPPLPSHGYFQPAGPLIHLQASNSVSTKSQNLTNLDSASATESQLPSSSSEDHAEAAIRSGDNPVPQPPPPPPSAAHHMGYPRGYPPYQGAYYQGSYYPPPPQSAHYQPPPPSFHHHYHHHQDLCYPPGYPPSSYPPPPPSSYRRFLQPPSSYYSPELTYGSSGPPPSQDNGAQQVVVPGGSSSSYSTPLEPYPSPASYYPGYSAGPTSACYSHPPPSRNLAFIEQTYQSCPCPMQLCPKNVHIGPLTGECKRPGALPLPPVALQLPQEPPGATGPPSPARGSAGMPPQPSPVSVSARPNWDGKQNKSSSDIKWEESKTGLEFKRSKCKTEILNCDKEIWDLSNRKRFLADSDKSVKSAEVQWHNLINDKKNDSTELCGQGLLAISSKEIMQKTARIHDFTETSIKAAEEFKKIKKETTTLPKNNFNSCNLENSPQKISLCCNISQPVADIKRSMETIEQIDPLEGNKKKKRKSDAANENLENNVKKAKKSGLIKQKDENLYGHVKVEKKNKKISSHKVTKLLRDRNETIEKKEKNGNKIKIFGKEDLKANKITETEGINGNVKIIVRRKSAQERSKGVSEIGAQTARKSKSCSPSRSKSQENISVRLLKEDAKRKQESIKFNKCKSEGKTKGFHEHSGPTVKRNNGITIVKGGKQVSFLNKSSQNCSSAKSKKSKSECTVGAVNLKKPTLKKALSSTPRTGILPKWSNGWSWDSESFDAKVYLTNDEAPVMRKCYTAMRHVQGDVIHPKDCILLKAGTRKIDLPFVAKVSALWENPDDGEMMVSLLWYYRPEHTDQGRQPSDQQDEIFASRHKDINSVACIEDKCFVLTYNEYCRYRKKVRQMEEGVTEKNASVPRLEQPYFRSQRQPPCIMAPDMVFFCRRVYDFRQKRLLKNPT